MESCCSRLGIHGGIEHRNIILYLSIVALMKNNVSGDRLESCCSRLGIHGGIEHRNIIRLSDVADIIMLII